ncbi:prepilin-type N-terminal cleavage/methylation domain-containing protein [Catenovulum sp. 2E275]|uniref:type IV pilus modification PilV family protein n=1 Tax=Catenovulum sp. 2E275 TaxID=2980497 RepID=UPI0021D015B8|nr:prepilin-type N-terminal cleavage/methylation domain-containing protein [Catenovulum sp. 2E275]MCU4675064.1 prepilin-type N-terminal cleavage/methylation domain-containing protein [Catenovulum sp. 2E275]
MKISLNKPQENGFTLIELVVGIMLIAIAMVFFINMLQNSNKFVADPWHQIRATELASALMSEITAKSFDENSDRSGGLTRCSSNDAGAQSCSAANNLQPDTDESNQTEFDDIDDYNAFEKSGNEIVSLNIPLNSELEAAYAQFKVSVKVFYDSNFDGVADSTIGQFKLIIITVTDPLGNQTEFASYKGNY